MRAAIQSGFALLWGVVMAAVAASAPAQEFRVESWVYRGNEKEPSSESLTLFQGGVVYDIDLPSAERVTIFDHAHGRFVLLDHGHHTKTIIPTSALLAFEQDLRTQPEYAEQSYLFAPKFAEDYDAKEQWLTLTADGVTYRAKTQKPDNPETVNVYRHFADWYARFNAYSGPHLHSLARISLNQSLAQRGFVPQEVKLTVVHKGLVSRKMEVRSRHVFNKLSQNDRQRIEKAGVGLADYKEISPADFKKQDKVAGK
jgi:hypothetical protein